MRVQLQGDARHRAAIRVGLVAACVLLAVFAVVMLGGCGSDSDAGDEGADVATASEQDDLADVSDVAQEEAATPPESPVVAGATTEALDLTYGDNAALVQDVMEIASEYPDDVSVSYIPLGVDTTMPAAFEVNGSTPRMSASLIKILVLAGVLEQVDEGAISLDDELTVARDDIVGGTGVIQGMEPGTKLTVRETAKYMITDSDNVGTNMLIDLIGFDAINDEAEALGLSDGTSLERKMMSSAGASQGLRNTLTSDDAATILADIATGTLVNEKSSELAEDFLADQNLTEGLDEGLPASVVVAHKTGSITEAFHDGGIIEAQNPYVLVVMTENLGEGEAQDVISDISVAVYEATNGDGSDRGEAGDDLRTDGGDDADAGATAEGGDTSAA